MDISNWIALGSLAISITTSIFSWNKFRKLDKKLKLQEYILNEYKLSDIEKTEIEKKKARIIIYQNPNDKKNLILKNEGMCTASNIKIDFKELTTLIYNINEIPTSLKPTEEYSLRISLVRNGIYNYKIHFSWKDDFCDKNETDYNIPRPH